MKTRMHLIPLLSGLFGLVGLFTTTVQAQLYPGWALDEHAFEYDMSMYVAVKKGSAVLQRWDELDLAAFCGTECRGIAEVQEIDSLGIRYYYLRVRSRSIQGDTIHFRYVDRKDGTSGELVEKLIFKQLDQYGYPSSPYTFTIPIPVDSVTLNSDNLTMISGEDSVLKATVLPADAYNKQVSWTSSDSAVATVSGSGLVTAHKAGTCEIAVMTTDGGFSAHCTVTVLQPATGLTLNKTDLTLDEGQEEQLMATVLPLDASDKQVVWSSSDTTIAVVSDAGLVKALKPGHTVVSAFTSDLVHEATCQLTVLELVGAPQESARNIRFAYSHQQLLLERLEPTDLIQLTSLDGNNLKLIRSGSSTFKLSFADFSPGCYFVCIKRGEKIVSFKLIR
ncbi:MAG: Ig domain-containing protein [Bacteroidota bacterium]|nr:Ig domain-containing protein [Bacteroidota bacterium]